MIKPIGISSPRVIAVFAVVINVLNGCSHTTVDEVVRDLRGSKYTRSFNTENHRIDVRYVPKILNCLALGGLDGAREVNKALLDSLELGRKNKIGMTFLLTLAPKNDSLGPTDYRNDVIYGKISGYSDYRDALQEYQFGWKEKIWVILDGKRYDLASYQMSNSWGMTKSRTFTLIFDIPEDSSYKKEITLVAENLVPGFGRESFAWKIPDTKNYGSI